MYVLGSSCDHNGKDYWGHNIKVTPNVGNATKCRTLCVAQAGCMAWTYEKSNKNCHLKKTFDAVLDNLDTVSGPKECKGNYFQIIKLSALK